MSAGDARSRKRAPGAAYDPRMAERPDPNDHPPRRSFIERARRAQIVEAATQVVAELGYAGTSLARIAEKAEISKSVITYHFESKDEILRLVVSQFFERAWAHMSGRVEAERTASGQVRAWIGAQLEFYAEHRAEFLAMSQIMANHRTPEGSPAFAGELTEEVDALTEILQRGQRDGEFRDFDARGVATIILRCADGVLGSWAIDDSTRLLDQIPALLDFVDHAIRR